MMVCGPGSRRRCRPCGGARALITSSLPLNVILNSMIHETSIHKTGKPVATGLHHLAKCQRCETELMLAICNISEGS